MASVAAIPGQKLYVLVNEKTGVIWLASIATNTNDPWKYAKQHATRDELKAEGWGVRPAKLALEEWPVTNGKKGGSEKRWPTEEGLTTNGTVHFWVIAPHGQKAPQQLSRRKTTRLSRRKMSGWISRISGRFIQHRMPHAAVNSF